LGNNYSESFEEHLRRFVGETVTIFTTSGGQSGAGFTGVLIFVNNCFVRLITNIGPFPGCALGNACSKKRCGNYNNSLYGYNDYNNGYNDRVGSVTDIPIDRIAAFVHNAV